MKNDNMKKNGQFQNVPLNMVSEQCEWSLVSFWLTPPPPFVSNGQHLPMSEVRVTTLTARVLRV